MGGTANRTVQFCHRVIRTYRGIHSYGRKTIWTRTTLLPCLNVSDADTCGCFPMYNHPFLTNHRSAQSVGGMTVISPMDKELVCSFLWTKENMQAIDFQLVTEQNYVYKCKWCAKVLVVAPNEYVKQCKCLEKSSNYCEWKLIGFVHGGLFLPIEEQEYLDF